MLVYCRRRKLKLEQISYKKIAPSAKTFSLVLAVESKFAARISRVNYAKLVSFNFGT